MGKYLPSSEPYIDETGALLVGGSVTFVVAGSTTKITIYSDSAESVELNNPVSINALGLLSSDVYFSTAADVVVKNSDGNTVYTETNSSVGASSTLDYSASATYSKNDLVKDTADDNYYISIADGNTGNTPNTTPTAWMQVKFLGVYNEYYTYGLGDIVLDEADNHLYLSQSGSNTNNLPSTNDGTNWKGFSNNAISEAAIAPSSDADVTLTDAQYSSEYLDISTGSWTQSRNIIVPGIPKVFFVDNKDNDYAATIKTSSGTGVTVGAGLDDVVVCDGTNCNSIARKSLNTVTISPDTDADVTLDSTQNSAEILEISTGSWTQARNIIIPDAARRYYVDNTSNSYDATIKTSGGTGAVVSATTIAIVVCDGTDCLIYAKNNEVNENKIINPDFFWWQDGTSVSVSGTTYTASQWQAVQTTGTTTVTRQTFTPGQTDVTGEPVYYLRVSRTVAEAASNEVLKTPLQGVDLFSGEDATFSVWLKAGSAKTFRLLINQNFGSGGSSQSQVGQMDVSVTTSWQRFSFSTAMDSISGKTIGTSSYVSLVIAEPPTLSTFTLDVANAKFENGLVATSFVKPIPTVEYLKLLAFYVRYDRNSISNKRIFLGQCTTTTTATFPVQFPVPMRIAPSITFSSATGFAVTVAAGTAATTTAITAVTIDTDTCAFNATIGAASLVAGNASQLLFLTSGTDNIKIDARL